MVSHNDVANEATDIAWRAVAGDGSEPVTIQRHDDGTADVCGPNGHATVGYQHSANGEILMDAPDAWAADMVHIE